MSDRHGLQQVLHRRIEELRARERVRAALTWSVRTALAAACAAVVTAIVIAIARPDGAARFFAGCAGFVPIAAALGGLVGFLLRVDDLRVARALDVAAGSDDRFASALQLLGHRKADRVDLVLADALARVDETPARAALPIRTPRELRWLPLPTILLGLVVLIAPQPAQRAQAADQPEVSAEEWKSLHDDLTARIDNLPEPQTPEERELADDLRRLADLLKQNPDKKDALAEIARLREELEKREAKLGSPAKSMRAAAQAMGASSSLSKFAQMLAAGDYEAAAAELERMAEELEQDKLDMDAEEYEAAAKDLENMAKQLEEQSESAQACRNAATAASRMNRQELSQALRKMSKSMKSQCKTMRKCDSMCRSRSILDELARRLSQCKGGKCNGDGDCDPPFTKFSDKKGGKKAGWGTASKWDGGKLGDHKAEHEGSMEDPAESAGDMSVTPMISPDERAASGQEYKEVYAEMVRKAEAGLDLETMPAAMRDYLRRYFVSIRPSDGEKTPDAEKN